MALDELPNAQPPLPSPQEFMQQIEEMKKRFEPMCEHIAMNAKYMWVAFENLRMQGFTEDQAVQLINGRGPFLD